MESLGDTDDTNRYQMIPSYVLDDLCSRFIINMTEEERKQMIRVCFQVELAHWFYIDFYCQDSDMKIGGIKHFALQVFEHCPFLQEHATDIEDILAEWKAYKLSVPTYGAILLDSSLQYVLLVQGYWIKTSWGYPKGKVNEDEEPVECAIREVLEETGYNICDMINEGDYLEYKISDQLAGLYLVPGIPLETEFKPKTRNEIKKLKWFNIDHLSCHRKDMTCKTELGISPNSFYMILPSIKPLRKWIAKRKDTTELQDSELTQEKDTEKNNVNQLEAKEQSEKKRLKQQQYFALQNKLAYEEMLQMTKSHHPRQHDSQKTQGVLPVGRGIKLQTGSPVRGTGIQSECSAFRGTKLSESPKKYKDRSLRKLVEQTPSSEPGVKKTYKILSRDGLSRELKSASPIVTTQTNKGKKDNLMQPKGSAKNTTAKQNENRHKDFMSKTWSNFAFDKEAIMNCFI